MELLSLSLDETAKELPEMDSFAVSQVYISQLMVSSLGERGEILQLFCSLN